MGTYGSLLRRKPAEVASNHVRVVVVAVIVFDQLTFTLQRVKRGSDGIGATCRVLETEADLGRDGAVLGLEGGVVVAEGVKDSGFSDRDGVHKILEFLKWVSIDAVQKRVSDGAQERHICANAADDGVPRALPNAESAALGHSGNTDVVGVHLNLSLKNSGRDDGVLEHPPENPGFGFVSSVGKVATFLPVALLVKSGLAMKVETQRDHAFSRSILIGEFGFATVGWKPEEGF